MIGKRDEVVDAFRKIGKRDELVDVFRKSKVELLAFTETKLKGYREV